MSTLSLQEITHFRQDCAALKTVEDILKTSEYSYAASHRKVLKPQKKPLISDVRRPQKKPLMTSLIFMCLFSIIAIILLINVVLSYVTMSIYTKIEEDPGKEYIDYVNAYNQIESVEQLESNWKAVENAWKKRGVNIDWNFVLDAAASHRIDSGEDFDSAIMSHLSAEWQEINTGNGIKVAVLICVIVPLTIVFINKFRSAFPVYKTEHSRYTENKKINKQNQDYNENIYPKLYKEWETAELEIISEYNATIAKAKKDKAELESSLSNIYQKFPPKYQSPLHVSNIYDIMAANKVDNVEMGVSFYEAKLKREEEERELRAAEARIKAEIEKARRDEQAAKDAAESRCKYCQYRYDCTMTEKTKYWDTGEMCPHYREDKRALWN